MVAVKKSVSFDSGVWAELSAEMAAGELSSFINEAVRVHLNRRRALQSIAEWEAENGAFTPEELAEADAALDAMGPGWDGLPPRRPREGLCGRRVLLD